MGSELEEIKSLRNEVKELRSEIRVLRDLVMERLEVPVSHKPQDVNGLKWEVLETLFEGEKLRSSEIAEKINLNREKLGHNAQTSQESVIGALNGLHDTGLIYKEKIGKNVHYMLGHSFVTGYGKGTDVFEAMKSAIEDLHSKAEVDHYYYHCLTILKTGTWEWHPRSTPQLNKALNMLINQVKSKFHSWNFQALEKEEENCSVLIHAFN